MSISFESTFNQFNTLSFPSGSHTGILECQNRLMEHSLRMHSKVMQVRFDLHYPSNGTITPLFGHISAFTDNFSRRLKRMLIQSHRVDPLYLWVRELVNSDFPHYHFLVWVNANAIQNQYTIFDIAEQVWGNVLNTNGTPLVHYCLNKNRPRKYDNGIILKRYSDDYAFAMQEAFRAGSYLSKVEDKESLNRFERSYGYSRI